MWQMFGIKMAKTKKNATFEKLPKIQKLQFWSTFFDLLTFSYA